MKIPFDIKYRPQIESGEYKVETRDGRRTRIICWDKIDDNYPIIALVPFHGMEESINYTNKGQYYREGEMTEDDLFIVIPEEEMTEFEMAIHRRLNLMNGENLLATELLEETKGMAAELLDLARKQLIEEQYTSDPRKTDLYKLGKAEAMKDLPRWERLYSNENADKIPDCIIPGKALDNRLVHRGFELKITDLEKLPGFKE